MACFWSSTVSVTTVAGLLEYKGIRGRDLKRQKKFNHSGKKLLFNEDQLETYCKYVRSYTYSDKMRCYSEAIYSSQK